MSFNRTSMESKRVFSFVGGGEMTFNRTSMESKLPYPILESVFESPFNRTSMESKPIMTVFEATKERHLLIEPVWNRNMASKPASANNSRSFNRTSMESKLIISLATLKHLFNF